MFNQVEDIYNIKDEKLIPYKLAVSDVVSQFNKYIIESIPRINNKYVDVMISIISFMPINI